MRRRVHAVLFGSLLLFVCVYTIIIYIHQRTLHTYEIHKHMRMYQHPPLSPPRLGVEQRAEAHTEYRLRCVCGRRTWFMGEYVLCIRRCGGGERWWAVAPYLAHVRMDSTWMRCLPTRKCFCVFFLCMCKYLKMLRIFVCCEESAFH